MREFFDLANNPLFVKHLRSRLRRSAVVPGVIIVAFLSLCIVFATHQFRAAGEPLSENGSQVFFWFQGILLVLAGGSQVASAIAQMKESGIIDYHRITPIPSPVQTVGIMLGAAIRELILYATTLPFALYLAIEGPIGVTNFAKLMLVQVGGAVMYFSLAMITGLSGGSSRGASGRFVAILAVMNITASSFFALGVYGPTLVTSMPVYTEVFIENEDLPGNKRRQAALRENQQWRQQQQQPQGGRRQNQNQFANPPLEEPKRPPVTFYSAPLPLVVQSLLFQGCLLTFFFIGASRRIHSARQPLYTKPIALLFLTTLSVLTLGSLWDSPSEGLSLGCAYFLVICALLLTNSVTASLGDIVKGVQRARKVSEMRVPLWSDLASNKFIVFFFACIIALTITIGLLAAPLPAAKMFRNARVDYNPWMPLVVGILTVLSYGYAGQYFGLAHGKRARGFFVLFVFFAWIVPIVLGMLVFGAADIKAGGYVLALSPILGIAFAGFGHIGELEGVSVQVAAIIPGALFTVFFLALLINEEKKLRDEVVDEHAARRRRKQDRMDDYEDVRE